MSLCQDIASRHSISYVSVEPQERDRFVFARNEAPMASSLSAPSRELWGGSAEHEESLAPPTDGKKYPTKMATLTSSFSVADPVVEKISPKGSHGHGNPLFKRGHGCPLRQALQTLSSTMFVPGGDDLDPDTFLLSFRFSYACLCVEQEFLGVCT